MVLYGENNSVIGKLGETFDNHHVIKTIAIEKGMRVLGFKGKIMSPS